MFEMDYWDRMCLEYAELVNKILKLESFVEKVENNQAECQGATTLELLKMQNTHMQQYATVLRKRLGGTW